MTALTQKIAFNCKYFKCCEALPYTKATLFHFRRIVQLVTFFSVAGAHSRVASPRRSFGLGPIGQTNVDSEHLPVALNTSLNE